MFTLPGVRVGDLIRHNSLTVFPLFTESNSRVEYLLSDEAIQSGSVVVQEVSEGGSVPELLVENKGDTRVLFLEGEELVGAKQNRVLNTSVLLPPRSKTKIPVSCVEQGRWAYHSRHFGSSGRLTSKDLRYTLRSSVSLSLLAGMGHCSDQGQVWDEVEKQHEALGVTSRTAAMSDGFTAYQQRINRDVEQFPYPPGAVGLAVAVGNHIVAVDLFDNPATCEKVWKRVLSSYILDAVTSAADAAPAAPPEVESLLTTLRNLSWEKVESVGDGTEYRVRSDHGAQASALALGETLVHGSLLTGA